MFDVLDMGASGLTAQRTRMDVIAQNILNADTTRNAAGGVEPYRRKFATLVNGRSAANPDAPGVHVARIESDKAPPVPKFEPGHPDADKNGMVMYPNVDLSVEFVNAIEASRAYEANVNLMEVTKSMMNSTLRLIA
jgi:flagellar basal-body rod protein FlgC